MAGVDQMLPEPYDHIEISVTSVHDISGREHEPMVHVMDVNRGQGHMLGVGRAEAEARVILDTIRQYRGEEAQPNVEQRLREARAEGWREGFITSTGMDRGYSSAPGSFPWAGDDEDLDAWNPYTGDGYRDPFSEAGD